MARHRPAVVAVASARRGRFGTSREVDRRLNALRLQIEQDTEPPEGEPATRAFRPRAIASVTGGHFAPQPVGKTIVSDADTVEFTDSGDATLLASAYSRLPEPWQTVLWHTHVERLSAAEVAPLVGRTANDVGELLSTAERGLADAFFLEYADAHDLDDDTGRIVALLPGHLLGTLPPADQVAVDEHLASTDETADGHGPADSRRMLTRVGRPEMWLAAAIAPGITSMPVEDFRRSLGTGSIPPGEAAVFAQRVRRRRWVATVAAALAIMIVLAGAIFLIGPFGDEPDDATTSVPTLPETTLPPTEATTTTSIDLRPNPDVRNTIEVSIREHEGPTGLRARVVDLEAVEATVTSPAPILVGGRGSFFVDVSNAGAQPAPIEIEFKVPSGVVFEKLTEGPAECSDPADASPFCALTIPAQSSTRILVRFLLEQRVTGVMAVEGPSLTAPFETDIVAVADLEHNSVGRGPVAMIGNTLMECDPGPAADAGVSCDLVEAGTGPVVNRWDVPMRYISIDPSMTNSSSATLDIPETATVTAAMLYWSGDIDERGQQVDNPDDSDTITLVLPDGERHQVTADHFTLGSLDSTQYMGSADVTLMVGANGAGEYTVGDLVTVETQGSYGGWSLVVVYDDPNLTLHQRLVTRPFAWVAPEPLFLYDADLPTITTPTTGSLQVLGFEGEPGFVPETLTVAGNPIGDDNNFNSSVLGERIPAPTNNLGIDIDSYALDIDAPGGLVPFQAASAKDGIRIAVLALSVELPS